MQSGDNSESLGMRYKSLSPHVYWLGRHDQWVVRAPFTGPEGPDFRYSLCVYVYSCEGFEVVAILVLVFSLHAAGISYKLSLLAL